MDNKQSNSLVNVDLKPLSDLGIHAIDKIEKACGFIYNPKGTQRDAIEGYVERVKAAHLSPEEEAALIFNARKLVKQFSRTKAIVNSAINHLNDTNAILSDGGLDEEWCSMFFDKAKHICNEEMQILWGRILAGELTKPGSIPRRLLYIMSVIEKDQAETFSALCKYTIIIDNTPYSLCNIISDREFWKSKNIHLGNITDLTTTGLISFSNRGYEHDIGIPVDKVCLKTFNGDLLEISLGNEPFSTLPIGDIDFTSSGIALYNSIDFSNYYVDPDFFVHFFKNRGFNVNTL